MTSARIMLSAQPWVLSILAGTLLFRAGGELQGAGVSSTGAAWSRLVRGAAEPSAASPLTQIISLDGQWLLATDPKNVGRTERWWESPVPGAKPARVPWVIQDTFPGYHGVAWYWREFVAPAQPQTAGRWLLRFWGVDYLGEIWLNGQRVGGHEGGETPFVLDVTSTLQPGTTNRLCVRVLNPTHQPIDGIVLNQTPRQARVIPYGAGAAYNCGGITDSVELLGVPMVRIDDVHVTAEPNTGIARVETTVHNANGGKVTARVDFSLAPAARGETVGTATLTRELAPGDTVISTEIKIANPHLWGLEDPYLYRATVRAQEAPSPSFHESSTRFGFRDFRFENGYFRLNGRRIFLRSSHTCNHFPVGQRLPLDPDQARRDLLDVKVMGFNAIRFIWGGAFRYQLDLCDEIGLMVYDESFASMWIDPSPQLAERFDRSVSELIRRDRNHPSIVIWGLLNEASDVPAFRHATQMLPFVRSLDPTRLVFLNAGRFDGLTTGAGGPFSQVEWWHSTAPREPWIVHNPLATPLATPFGFDWPPGQVCFHPGEKGEYSVARWTAPGSGKGVITARFFGCPKMPATTDTHVLVNGHSLFDGAINLDGKANEVRVDLTNNFASGDTLDFVVGYGNQSYGSDTTGLEAKIRLDTGRVYDLAKDFSKASNPAGPWSYGMLKPGPAPDSRTFALYTAPGRTEIFGSISNPGSDRWEDLLIDQHNYPRVPHTAAIVQSLRSQKSLRPIFLSEYGIGSAVDLWRVTRHFERLGKQNTEEAQFYGDKLNRYLADWTQWKLAELYPHPKDFFAESLRKMAGQRTLGLNAIRANANYVGYSLTGMNDHVSCGEGLTTTFRELKPGTVDALFEGFAPLRLCLFAEPVNLYRGGRVRLEAVLANEDALPPGRYPVRLQLVGPDNVSQLDRTVEATIPEAKTQPESPLAFTIATEELAVDGPPGKYRFLATFENGAAPTGGECEFYVADAAVMPKVESEVVIWGKAPALEQWLAQHSVKVRPFSTEPQTAREVILIGEQPEAGGASAFTDLARHIARGSTAVFLSPKVFQKPDQPLGWLPLASKGKATAIYGWLYLKDEWAKSHPIFEGLPAGGLMDYVFYRELIPDLVWTGQEPPAEAVAGAIKASQDYASGLMVALYPLGAGRFLLNTLLIQENLGVHPAAERLLRNMLRYAARNCEHPLAELPNDFASRLKAIGYQ